MGQRKIKRKISPTRIIASSFALTIFIGTLLLMLPAASASGEAVAPIDCLFTATTSVCVTGLVTVSTANTWSLFGQIIILILIQLGGLGIVTISTGVFMIIGKRIDLHGRILLGDSFNLDTLSGLVAFLKKVFLGTMIVELSGAILYSFSFIKRYGVIKGIWYSVFLSISAFCNAGMDLLGDNSLQDYVLNPYINVVTMSLIVLGGLGFIVWWDVLHIMKQRIKHEIPKTHLYRRLRLHSRIVLSTTLFLIFIGAAFIFLLEYNNAETIGSFTLAQKIMASIFQSVTTRTAGFFTVPQENFKESSALICLVLMLIGGSPIGTAGGIKTTTIAMLYFTTRAVIRGEDVIIVHGRNIPKQTVQKAVAIIVISISFVFLATFILSIIVNGNIIDLMYEATSALATVGLSRALTSTLMFSGKILIIICMYAGRIGPMSLLLFFNMTKKKRVAKYPKEDITVG